MATADDNQWDVIVAGAGPAGSTAAALLARRGIRVLLADRQTFPRPKVCGCCLNARGVERLAEHGLPIASGAPLHRVDLRCGRRRASVRTPVGLAISRAVLDLHLARCAENAGARLLMGCGVEFPEDNPSRPITLSTTSTPPTKSTLSTRLLLDATGLGTRGRVVARGSRVGAGATMSEALGRIEPGTIHMNISSGGYVGLVRLQDGSVDLAAAFDPDFLRQEGGLGPAAARVLGQCGWNLPGIAELDWRGTPALTQHHPRVAEPGLFRLGDAAGYVEPFTGEGMSWALADAVAVAPVAERWLVGDAGAVAAWEAHHHARRRAQYRCRALAAMLRRPALVSLALSFLGMAPWAAAPLVGRFGAIEGVS